MPAAHKASSSTPVHNGSGLLVRGVIALMCVQTSILLAGIPWALTLHGSIRTIEVEIAHLTPLGDRYIALLERVKACEVRIQGLNEQRNTGDPFDAVPGRQ